MKRSALRLFSLTTLLALILPAGDLVADFRSAEGSTPLAGSMDNSSNVGSPLSVTDLTATASGNDLLLTWSHLGAGIDHYEVHRGRAPYFERDDASFVSSVSPDGSATLEYPDAGRAGTANYFYVVAPVETGGTVQPASNAVPGLYLYNPAAGITQCEHEITFGWSTGQNAASYHFELDAIATYYALPPTQRPSTIRPCHRAGWISPRCRPRSPLLSGLESHCPAGSAAQSQTLSRPGNLFGGAPGAPVEIDRK